VRTGFGGVGVGVGGRSVGDGVAVGVGVTANLLNKLLPTGVKASRGAIMAILIATTNKAIARIRRPIEYISAY
jgi:hypothetical protein